VHRWEPQTGSFPEPAPAETTSGTRALGNELDNVDLPADHPTDRTYRGRCWRSVSGNRYHFLVRAGAVRDRTRQGGLIWFWPGLLRVRGARSVARRCPPNWCGWARPESIRRTPRRHDDSRGSVVGSVEVVEGVVDDFVEAHCCASAD
jgi:hypothetical protein